MTRQLLLTVAALATLGAACEPQAEEPGGTTLDDLFATERLVVMGDELEALRGDFPREPAEEQPDGEAAEASPRTGG